MSKFNIVYTKIVEIVKSTKTDFTKFNKLPKLKGVFESNQNLKDNYIAEANIEKGSESDNKTIEMLLKKLQNLLNFYANLPSSFEEMPNKFVFKSVIDSNKTQVDQTDYKNSFMSFFDQEYKYFLKASRCKPFKTKPNIIFKWYEEKVYDLQKKLPELEGIFESVEIAPNFYLMKEEEEAINEIAETCQKLFQEYEKSIVAIMTALKKDWIELQDHKLNKYIGVTHLRNELRISIAKICKKHFVQFDKNRPMGKPELYGQYERFFLKPITGSTHTTKGGVGLKYEDDIFEVVFDAYDYVLGEAITKPKSIEPNEVKDYLKKLLETWLNAIVTNGQYYFTKEYLKFREEKAKFHNMSKRLPELEGIFEDARPHSGPDVLFQNAYITFNPVKREEYVEEFEKCLKQLKKVIESDVGWGRSNLAKCKCQIEKNKNIFTFIVKKVPFTEMEADPKQKHYAEHNLITTFWENLMAIMRNYKYRLDNISINKSIWRDSKIDELEKKLPELKGIF